jgi:hypothetical protein
MGGLTKSRFVGVISRATVAWSRRKPSRATELGSKAVAGCSCIVLRRPRSALVRLPNPNRGGIGSLLPAAGRSVRSISGRLIAIRSHRLAKRSKSSKSSPSAVVPFRRTSGPDSPQGDSSPKSGDSLKAAILLGSQMALSEARRMLAEDTAGLVNRAPGGVDARRAPSSNDIPYRRHRRVWAPYSRDARRSTAGSTRCLRALAHRRVPVIAPHRPKASTQRGRRWPERVANLSSNTEFL